MDISQAVHFIKDHCRDSIPSTLVHRLCRQIGYEWRERELGPSVTTHLFVQQVLHGNVPVPHLRRLTHQDFTPSAYCQARARLPLGLLRRLQRQVTGQLCGQDWQHPEATWCGHRTFLIDGSSFSMPDTDDLQRYFGQPGQQAVGCGFPVAHLLALFDGQRGYLLRAEAAPLRTHDLNGAAVMHGALQPGDVLVGDRAFGSYGHLALCRKRRIHGVFRAHQRKIISFRQRRGYRPQTGPASKRHDGRPTSRWIKRLGKHDQWVEYFKPEERPEWMSAEEYAELPNSIIVRELRYRVREPGRRSRVITLVTTLLDPKRYSAAALAKLYGLRWRVETNLKHLKQTMRMDVLRCETVEGVLKELAVFVLIYNLVRRVMLTAARRQHTTPERISFIDAWRWLQNAQPGDRLPDLVVNPERPERYEPRVRKRRPKPYGLMNKPRAVLRELLKTMSCERPK